MNKKFLFFILLIIVIPSTVAQIDIGEDLEEISGVIIGVKDQVAQSFLDLTDTPSSYSSFEGFCVAVNGAGTALKFQNCTNATTGGGGGGAVDSVVSGNDFIVISPTTGDVIVTLDTEVLNNTIASYGLAVGFNDTFNSTYQLFAYNQTEPANTYTDLQISFINTTGNLQLLLNDTGIYSTFNETYDMFAYNQSDGSFNATYALFAYNQSINVPANSTTLAITNITGLATTSCPAGEFANVLTFKNGILTFTCDTPMTGGDFFFANFTASFDSNFSDKTTDDLTQGTTNLYDNRSWNQTFAETLFIEEETDPVFVAQNQTIWDAIGLRFLITAFQNAFDTNLTAVLPLENRTISSAFNITGLNDSISQYGVDIGFNDSSFDNTNIAYLNNTQSWTGNQSFLNETSGTKFYLQFNRFANQTGNAGAFLPLNVGETPTTTQFGTDGKGQPMTRDYVITGIGVNWDTLSVATNINTLQFFAVAGFFDIRISETVQGSATGGTLPTGTKFHNETTRPRDEVVAGDVGSAGDQLQVYWRVNCNEKCIGGATLEKIIVTVEGYYLD